MASLFVFIVNLLQYSSDAQDHIDEFDPDKRRDDSAKPVDEQVAPQNAVRSHGTIFDPLEGDGNQQRNDDGIEDQRREDGALRVARP